MISKRIVLHFPQRLVDKPIVYRLIKDYRLEFNILKAYVTPQEEGLMVLELRGEDAEYEKGLEYLKESGVKIQPLSEDIVRNSEKCTDCGVCVTICPAEALVVDPATRKVIFDQEKCIACELCIKICPTHAMEVHF
ncbi:MAG: 4Fe-4S binding protein [Candidatus Omnitrophica bacterium]|jgi:ferredoxin|nr:4Fe-4S binding protein [Candidatus Omnitrophota bacterium]